MRCPGSLGQGPWAGLQRRAGAGVLGCGAELGLAWDWGPGTGVLGCGAELGLGSLSAPSRQRAELCRGPGWHLAACFWLQECWV